jgi:hypothetical protein
MLGAPPGPAGSGLPNVGRLPSARARAISARTCARVFGPLPDFNSVLAAGAI